MTWTWALLYLIPAAITASLTRSPSYHSRWRRARSLVWRVGICRGECWVGVRYSFGADALKIAVLPGLILAIGHG